MYVHTHIYVNSIFADRFLQVNIHKHKTTKCNPSGLVTLSTIENLWKHGEHPGGTTKGMLTKEV